MVAVELDLANLKLTLLSVCWISDIGKTLWVLSLVDGDWQRTP